MSNPLREGLKKHFSETELARLERARVGICGAGGLGSNVALNLVRSGVMKMRLVDFDVVEPSNLNRQQYFPRHVGKPKVEALAEIIRELNPDAQIETRRVKITRENLPELLAGYDLWAEALDDAGAKAFFVSHAAPRASLVVSASGLCGCGGPDMRKKRLGNIIMAGDFETGTHIAPPLAPRVTQAAAIMADAILEYALRGVK